MQACSIGRSRLPMVVAFAVVMALLSTVMALPATADNHGPCMTCIGDGDDPPGNPPSNPPGNPNPDNLQSDDPAWRVYFDDDSGGQHEEGSVDESREDLRCWRLIGRRDWLGEPPSTDEWSAVDRGNGSPLDRCSGDDFDPQDWWEERDPDPHTFELEPGRAITGLPAWLVIDGAEPLIDEPIGPPGRVYYLVTAEPDFCVAWGDEDDPPEVACDADDDAAWDDRRGIPYTRDAGTDELAEAIRHAYDDAGDVEVHVFARWIPVAVDVRPQGADTEIELNTVVVESSDDLTVDDVEAIRNR